ncbi:hypothetical protein JXA80_06825, partial [bacterium]|nr:hypothetical protein [candidate division CSSED10-310 bacterium]
GAQEDDDMGDRSGSAYIFIWEADHWSEDTKLVAPDGTPGSQFGYSVAIAGDYVIVGAFRDTEHGNQAGAAYIWKRVGTTWQYVQKLQPTIPEANSEFGNAVALTGDYAVVCAHRAQHLGNMTGAVYVFERNGSQWIQDAKIVEDSLSPSGFFGCDAAISGNNLIVGANKDATSGFLSGAAYVYLHDGVNWNLQQKLLPSDMMDNIGFGKSVAIDSNCAIIGAPVADGLAPDTGAAYVFYSSAGSWTQTQKLSSDPPSPDEGFGWAVDLCDGYIAVGAPWFSSQTVNFAGKMVVFTESGSAWLGGQGFTASDLNVNAQLGMSVSVQMDEAIGGAYGAEHEGSFTGAAYVFRDFTSATPTPTPTPSSITYDIDLYDTNLRSGDVFRLTRKYFNPFAAQPVDEYILLDVYGSYWFWPGWSMTPNWAMWTCPAATGGGDVILEFTWPMVDGTVEDLRFWGAFLAGGTTQLIVYDKVTWGYSNK